MKINANICLSRGKKPWLLISSQDNNKLLKIYSIDYFQDINIDFTETRKCDELIPVKFYHWLNND